MENDIGWAVGKLRDGYRVRRQGWNGKRMYLAYVKPEAYRIWQMSGAITLTGYEQAPWVAMKTADDKVVPWLCSQTDLLASDWEVVPNSERA